jgi:hypothetical protein
MLLVHALSPLIGIGPCTFFCLIEVYALCKKPVMVPSLISCLRGKNNRVPHGPLNRHQIAHYKTKFHMHFLYYINVLFLIFLFKYIIDPFIFSSLVVLVLEL